MTTLVTLALDPATQAHFEAMRQRYYPPELNRIPAHLSLFHKLPGTREVHGALRDAANRAPAFTARVNSVRSLGRGVAYTVASPELMRLHADLASSFEPHLTAQDRQRFQPHIVVQNKATPVAARELLATLEASFRPTSIEASGVLWWEYLGGPWRLIETFAFAPAAVL